MGQDPTRRATTGPLHDTRKWYCHRCARFTPINQACISCGHMPRAAATLSAEETGGRQVTSLAHDIRSHLTTIVGYLRLMEASAIGPMTPEQLECVRHAMASAGRMVNLLNELPE